MEALTVDSGVVSLEVMPPSEVARRYGPLALLDGKLDGLSRYTYGLAISGWFAQRLGRPIVECQMVGQCGCFVVFSFDLKRLDPPLLALCRPCEAGLGVVLADIALMRTYLDCREDMDLRLERGGDRMVAALDGFRQAIELACDAILPEEFIFLLAYYEDKRRVLTSRDAWEAGDRRLCWRWSY